MRFLLIFFFFIGTAQAEVVELKAKIGFIPEKAIGIIFDQKGARYFNQTNIDKIKSGETIVSFRTDEYSSGSYASALLMGADGEVAFASVKMLADIAESMIANLPECHEQLSDDLSAQSSLLEQLVKLRLQRLEIQKQKLRQYLTPEFLEKLIKLEKKHGIQEVDLLNATTPPEIINLRLFRLINAIN